MNNMLGKPHFELIEKTGFRETMLGRYPTRERAEGEKQFLLRVYAKMGLSHGEFIVRPREF